MKIVTDRISPDEPCYGLAEMNRMLAMPDRSMQWRRVQAVYVVRGDAIAEYTTDLGPASAFKDVDEACIFSMGDDRVGDLMEAAAYDRMDDTYKNLRDQVRGESTLLTDFITQKEKAAALINNRSVLGPLVSHQRNGFPQMPKRKEVF